MNGVDPDFTQDNRLISVDTVLGKDVLLLTEFSGQESISNLFSFHLTMLSGRSDIKSDDLVGSKVTVMVKEGLPGAGNDGPDRFFNGRVRSLSAGDGHAWAKVREYHAEIVPDLWFLTRTANCKIFQDKTAKEIIEAVLKDFGVENVKFNLQKEGDLPKINFCVQYRETAFNFISRLMERFGIFYFFEHEDGRHTLNIVDGNTGCVEATDRSIYHDHLGHMDSPHVRNWTHSYEFRSSVFVQNDLNFTDANQGGSQEEKEDSVLAFPAGPRDKYEIYDYPGGYDISQDGKTLARTRMKQEEAPHDVVEGAGNVNAFYAGAKFKLQDHFFESELGGAYILTAVNHFASDDTYFQTSAQGSDSTVYTNTFRCIPEKYDYQPQRKTIKPRISGTQTAIVVGKAGEDSWSDDYGRVKVQFHWDREGQNDENSSCWIRVGQIWAGPSWGAYFVPRIGHEVIVEFLEGDPDRPIITGSVYNYDNHPPYTPDGGADGGPVTTSTIKSLTSQGGSASTTYNELRFEDEKGEEEIFIQAEKNLKITVKNDRETVIGEDKADPGDDKLIVQNDQNIEIRNDQIVEILNDQKINVTNEITIEAGSKITLTTGASSITMSSDGTIDIEGVTVTLKGSGTADVESPSTTIKGSGVVTIEGGMVKIN